MTSIDRRYSSPLVARFSRWGRWAIGGFYTGVALLACGAPMQGEAQAKPGEGPAAANSARPPSKPKPQPTAKPAAPVATSTPAPKPASAAPRKEAAAEEGPSSCPAGMKLVEGEYCTKVEHNCLKSWYDESNKKTVCEEFEAKATCVGQRVKKRFCIDSYEWPNKKGERPEVMNRFHQAQLKCAAVGKRMCTETEWTFACEGPEMKPFPYGYKRDVNKCHGDMEWDSPDMKRVAQRDPTELARLWRGVRSGSQPQCVSDFGVSDLPGNADEVTSSETTEGWKGKYDSVHTGGPWYKGVRNQCRPKIYTHDEGFYYYFLSFRCCAEPDGKPTDFRTPRQVKENWKLEKLERLAGFTLAEVQQKLELKKTTPDCGCSAKDIRCKTICGTLLGPEAKDVVKK